MKQPLLFLLLLCSTLLVGAGESCWVRKTFAASGTGMYTTEPMQIFGDECRIRYRTGKRGDFRIIVHDASQEGERLPSRVLVSSRSSQRTSSKSFKGYSQVYFTIEGDINSWALELDQYMDSMSEWKYRNYAKTLPLKTLKEGSWYGEGSQVIEYVPRKSPSKIQFDVKKAGVRRIQAVGADGKTLLDYPVNGATAKISGWIYVADAIKFVIEADEGASWQLEVFSL